jgi:hypothetical protein
MYLTILDNELIESMSAAVTVDGKKTEKLNDHPDLKATLNKLKPHQLISFATGSTRQPACGWPSRPTIVFDHNATLSYPSASTCSLTLSLPVTAANVALDSFLFCMGFGLCHGGMFSDG